MLITYVYMHLPDVNGTRRLTDFGQACPPADAAAIDGWKADRSADESVTDRMDLI